MYLCPHPCLSLLFVLLPHHENDLFSGPSSRGTCCVVVFVGPESENANGICRLLHASSPFSGLRRVTATAVETLLSCPKRVFRRLFYRPRLGPFVSASWGVINVSFQRIYAENILATCPYTKERSR